MKKICIIGLGNMGQAIFGILSMDTDLEVSGCDRGDSVNGCLENCEAFIVAVKPQDFEELCAGINVDLSNKLAISIMAGVSIDKISQLMRAKRIIRVMPNLPLRIQRAMSGWIANENATEEDKEFIKKILKEFGSEVEVDKEEKINAITALSGSGPAYFFKLTEMLANAAKKYGFKDEDAKKISEATLIGAAELLKNSDDDAATLREKITSKGGTTEAAFKSVDLNNIEKIVIGGVEAARKRAEELNS